MYSHIENVNRSWEEILKPALLRNQDIYDYAKNYMASIDITIANHDKSKFDDSEYIPYLHHFYGSSEEKESSKEDFNYAWLLHQKRNPHHWQFWVLIQDGDDIEILDMEFSEICNMICDWHSFSAKDKNSTAYNWYYKNKDKMMLSENTRLIVEELIEYMKKPLV